MLLQSVPLGDFSEHFRLGKRLGEGSFAEVFEASRRSESDHLIPDGDILPRTYAVKRIDRDVITANAETRVYTEVGRHSLTGSDCRGRGTKELLLVWQ